VSGPWPYSLAYSLGLQRSQTVAGHCISITLSIREPCSPSVKKRKVRTKQRTRMLDKLLLCPICDWEPNTSHPVFSVEQAAIQE